MIWIEDEDIQSVLFYLCEAKGSIGAMIDLADDDHAEALLEDSKRICEAIGTLLESQKKVTRMDSLDKPERKFTKLQKKANDR